MLSSPPALATYADLLALPDDAKGEILGGQLVTAPAPLPQHANVQGAARSFLGRPFHDDDGRGGPGGWWIFAEVDVALGAHDVVRPDLSGWRRERLTQPGKVRPIEVVPDWACEIISPSSAARDRVTKRNLYARCGIPFYWLIDPDARVLEALALRDGIWVETGVFDDSATARIAPFEAIELQVGRLFLPREVEEG